MPSMLRSIIAVVATAETDPLLVRAAEEQVTALPAQLVRAEVDDLPAGVPTVVLPLAAEPRRAREAELRLRRTIGALAAVVDTRPLLVFDVASFTSRAGEIPAGGLRAGTAVAWSGTHAAAVDSLLDIAERLAGDRQLTVVHKGNSIKRTDGLLARRAQGRQLRTVIVDNFAAQLAADPGRFGCVVTHELYAALLLGTLAGARGGPPPRHHRLVDAAGRSVHVADHPTLRDAGEPPGQRRRLGLAAVRAAVAAAAAELASLPRA
jgi:hypothetical protein